MLAVAEHYYHFDGRSQINDQNRALIEELKKKVGMPVYWGNRNWHPMLADTVRQMTADGVKRVIAFATSAFGSYSGCRQYLENIEKARAATPDAPVIDKIRPFSTHPKFLAAMTDRVRVALQQLPHARIAFTAHSIPVSMAESSPYARELEQACAAVAVCVGSPQWSLVYQSRSGPPTQPWLGPDILDHLREIRSDVVVAPIGFLSDHMEVIYDLDTEAKALADELGIRMVRAGTVGTHPLMIEMIAEMVEVEPQACAAGCCAAPARRPG